MRAAKRAGPIPGTLLKAIQYALESTELTLLNDFYLLNNLIVARILYIHLFVKLYSSNNPGKSLTIIKIGGQINLLHDISDRWQEQILTLIDGKFRATT